jgi:hypothetical protein
MGVRQAVIPRNRRRRGILLCVEKWTERDFSLPLDNDRVRVRVVYRKGGIAPPFGEVNSLPQNQTAHLQPLRNV